MMTYDEKKKEAEKTEEFDPWDVPEFAVKETKWEGENFLF